MLVFVRIANMAFCSRGVDTTQAAEMLRCHTRDALQDEGGKIVVPFETSIREGAAIKTISVNCGAAMPLKWWLKDRMSVWWRGFKRYWSKKGDADSKEQKTVA